MNDRQRKNEANIVIYNILSVPNSTFAVQMIQSLLMTSIYELNPIDRIE